jgi:hypothetical protein
MDARLRNPIFTTHARLRMAEMGVSGRMVKRILRSPEVDYEQGDRDGGRVAQRGNLAVAYVLDSSRGAERPLVLTVLYRTADPYPRRVLS